MIINIDGGNGGGGGGYVLPIASASVLGGVKVGSGLTIDNAGRLSTSGGSAAEAFKVTVSSHHADEWTSDDYSALTEMVEYLSGRTDMVEAYIDAVSMDGNELSGGERFTLSYMEREAAVFSFPDYTTNLLYWIYLNFEDVEASEANETIIPEEGSGDSNYVIVDSLKDIDEPTEGLMASVPSYSSETSTNKIYISDIEAFSSDHGGIEGYLGHFLYTGSTPSDPNQSALYISGDQFNWDLENDGQWHTRTYDFDGTSVSIEYRTHNEPDGNAWLEYVPVTENVTFDCENNVAETALTPLTEWHIGKTYVYRVGEWIQTNGYHYFNDPSVDLADSGETDNFVNDIVREVEAGLIPFIYSSSWNYPVPFEGIGRDGDGHVTMVTFTGNRGNDMRTVFFSSIYGTHGDNGFNEAGVRIDTGVVAETTQYQHTINITSGGTFDNPDQLGKFSEENHTDQIIFKIDGDYGVWSQAPIKYVYRTRSQEEDQLVYYWSVEIPVNGTLYRGVWHTTEGDWGNYVTDTWAAVN